MNYHFDQTLNRRATDSIKWDVKSNELPMWIADMDFPTAPEIVTAMQEKVRTGIFGYEEIPADYFRAWLIGMLRNTISRFPPNGCCSPWASCLPRRQSFGM